MIKHSAATKSAKLGNWQLSSAVRNLLAHIELIQLFQHLLTSAEKE